MKSFWQKNNNNEKYNEWQLDARRKFMTQKYREALTLEWQLGIGQDEHSIQLQEHISQLKQLRKAQLAEKRLDSYIFLTINQNKFNFENNFSETNINKVLNILNKQCNRKFVKNYTYCIEQRGTVENNNIGKGMHIHLLFERALSYKPATIKRDLKSGFKKLFTNDKLINHPEIFNFKKCGKEFAQKRLEYIKGNKDDDKKLKCKADIIFRNKLNLKDFYQN